MPANREGQPRGFSVRYALTVVGLLSLAAGALTHSIARESYLSFAIGACCSGAALAMLLVVLPNWLRRAAVACLSACALYTSTYLVLTLNGRYEPITFGAGHVKTYRWSPAGFDLDYPQAPATTRALMRIFLPLYMADISQWHADVRSGYDGDYPIRRVP